MAKYPVKKEFFPYSRIAPPIQNARIAGWMGSKMKPPVWVRRNTDAEVSVTRHSLKSYDGAEISAFVFSPRKAEETLPCLVYYHGGGFFFEGAGYHYRLVKQYAMEADCRVIFAQYRLAPKHPHPTPAEDCYAVLRFAVENAGRLGLDAGKIAVGGDSAGGALAAAVCQMARDRGTELPLFQLLIYPVTDRRMNHPSCIQYTDTPMWNAKLSRLMWEGYVGKGSVSDVAYASPMEAKRFDGLPAAYVESAEFDCLHDEGLAYADALEAAGVPVWRNETDGTMHGFDIVKKAPTAKAAAKARIAFLRERFYGDGIL